MLPDGPDVARLYRETLFGSCRAGDLAAGLFDDDVETARRLSAEANDLGLQMVDAPVSGGPEGAGAGTLSFMVGADERAFARAQPLLAAMGTKITHFGPVGSGQAAKACHNMICGITALAVCESFALAEALGLDAERFFHLCKGAAAQAGSLRTAARCRDRAPSAPSSNGYAPGFAARLMAKDLRLAQEAAKASGQETPFGAEAAQRFAAFAETEGADLDFSAIYRSMRKG